MENKLSKELHSEANLESGKKIQPSETRTVIRKTRIPRFQFKKSLTQQLPDVFEIQGEFPQSESQISPTKLRDTNFGLASP
jgi:hypothetical protein